MEAQNPTLDELKRARTELERFVCLFDRCIKTTCSRQHMRTYIGGQLSPIRSKSVAAIALEAGVPPRSLQEFLEIHRWDHEAVRSKPPLVRPRKETRGVGRPRSQGCLAPGAEPPLRVSRLAGPRGPQWKRFHVKETLKGAGVWEVRSFRFFPWQENSPGEEGRLIVARNLQDNEVKYFLSNAPRYQRLLAEIELPGLPLPQEAEPIKASTTRGRSFGLAKVLQHHVALSC